MFAQQRSIRKAIPKGVPERCASDGGRQGVEKKYGRERWPEANSRMALRRMYVTPLGAAEGLAKSRSEYRAVQSLCGVRRVPGRP